MLFSFLIHISILFFLYVVYIDWATKMFISYREFDTPGIVYTIVYSIVYSFGISLDAGFFNSLLADCARRGDISVGKLNRIFAGQSERNGVYEARYSRRVSRRNKLETDSSRGMLTRISVESGTTVGEEKGKLVNSSHEWWEKRRASREGKMGEKGDERGGKKRRGE